MQTTILIDSCCDLPYSYIEENNLTVVKFSFVFKGDTYEDDFGNTIPHKLFFDEVRKGEMPSTTQVNIYQYEQIFKSILDKGENLIYICFSSALSGSFNSANTAKRNLLEVYPEASIEVIDSRAASLGEGLLCHHVLELAKKGATGEEIIKWIDDNKLRVNHFFTVSDLNHLKRGGRISSTAATVGTILNIKPMLTVDPEGRLKVIDKVRGRKKALKELADIFIERVEEPETQMIAICHGDCEEDALFLEGLIREKAKVKEVMINSMGPVIGSHTGPDVIALFFMGKARE